MQTPPRSDPAAASPAQGHEIAPAPQRRSARSGERDLALRVIRRGQAISHIAILARTALDLPDGERSRRLMARVERLITTLKATPL